MMGGAPLLFLDIETLGVKPTAPIWEVAAMRFEGGTFQGSTQVFMRHDPDDMDPELPQRFQLDYRTRYDTETAKHPKWVLERLQRMAEGRAIVCGSNARFDMDMLERLAAAHGVDAPGWHYHPNDVPNMVHGYLLGRGIAPAQPWRTDFMSQAIGIDPRDFDRHTALGDAQWCRAMWEAIGADGGRG